MKQLIFLDDERDIGDVTWIKYPQVTSPIFILRNFEEFKWTLPLIKDWENTIFSFDHDLQDFNEDGSENTGMTCVKYLVNYCIEHSITNINYIIHSKNPIGSENMSSYIESYLTFIKG